MCLSQGSVCTALCASEASGHCVENNYAKVKPGYQGQVDTHGRVCADAFACTNTCLAVRLSVCVCVCLQGKADEWQRAWALKPSMAYELFMSLANVMKVSSVFLIKLLLAPWTYVHVWRVVWKMQGLFGR